MYHKVVPCDAPQCLVASVRAYLSGDENFHERGILHPNQTFENYIVLKGLNEQVFKCAYDFAHDSEWFWLLLYGPTGNGKSHLLNAIGTHLAEMGKKVILIAVPELMDELKRGFETGQSSATYEQYRDVDCLLLDDWGVEYGTEWSRAKFEELMLSRFNRGLRTVVTTNKDVAALPDRIYSRFQDARYARMALNQAPDYRKKREMYVKERITKKETRGYRPEP